MKGWNRKTWMGCVVALALGVPVAHASTSGTITFVGAVVVPTCNVGDASASVTSHGYRPCVAGSGESAPPTSSYRQEVAPLEGDTIRQDRLLTYFSGYASNDHTQLLTRTYE